MIDELGQGGMGVVYRCFDEVAGINVALKALPPEVGHNAGEMEEVRENFRLVEKLHHPNIANVKTLEKDPVTGDYYLVMECVEGLDLRQWARKRRGEGRPLTTDEVVTVAYRIAEALDYAHSQRVIHRDIKPSNVRITFDGDVKVLDFGLAAQIYTSMSRVSRAYHGTSGTGPYMAPEQWQGRRQDAAADQYALAASVYELLSGAPPFENHDVSVLREAVLKDRPEPLAGVPEHVNAALMRALAKEPGERFATCGEFVAALGGARAETQRRGGKRTVLWLAAAVALAFGTYGTYASYRSYTARRAAERAAAERALALDAAQKAKIDGLKAAAEGALAAGDLESAGARIAELKAAGAPAAGELQKRYEAKAGERETNRRYAAASVAREKAAKLERGQGFGARLDALEVTWREAEAARQGGVWGQALSGYDAVLAASKALEELEASREEAKARRGDAERAKAEADQANSASDAKDLYA
ncbi:MAG TPA: protein kinase, partial [Candidatus Brocadiia bacterium]|nr:protein kinase [Candidatus Brocadiia bacterium]